MNAKLHSHIIGGPAKIADKAGSDFSAHGGYITGKNIHLVKDKLIVQTWRSLGWDKDDVDSIFMIKLEPKGKDVILYAVHTNLPDKAVESVSKGWYDHYWNPWKQYLAGKPITRPKM
jgi:activator of HSP90 ATPase